MKTLLPLPPGQLDTQGYQPTLIIAGPDPDTGDDRVIVSAPGAHSENRVTTAGDLSLTVSGGDAGRPGEPTVLHVFEAKLKTKDVECTIRPGSDQHGEDAIILIGSRRFVTQVVSGITDPAFWNDARKNSASRGITVGEAAEFLNASIVKKANSCAPSQARDTVLLIDARHMAFLSTDSVIAEFTQRFGDPSAAYGFFSVWVVGPTANHAVRIGGTL